MFSPRDFGLKVSRKTANNESQVFCPYHDDKHASATFNHKTGLFYCFSCLKGATWRTLLKTTGVSGGGWDASDVEELSAYPESVSKEFYFDLFTEYDERRLYGDKRHNPYVKNRGVSRSVEIEYGLEMVPGTIDYSESVLFPINDLGGNRIGALLRSTVDDNRPRYKKIGHMTPIWPVERLRKCKEGERILIVEGAFSALRVATACPELPVFSTFGARVPKGITDLLIPFNPIVLYDLDAAGHLAADKLKRIAPSWFVRCLHTSPDDMNDRTIRRLMIRIHEILDRH